MPSEDLVISPDRAEIEAGERFEFGRNWARFLRLLDDRRVQESERNLKEFLQTDSLAGQSFLDVGSGSGLSSLAARRLGALVTSFDFDQQSVACTRELKRRYFPNDPSWTIHHGSVLDPAFLRQLGRFDIVYSWGVLHHTGALWQAMDNVKFLVKPAGRLFIAIYNDAGKVSQRWLKRKRRYQTLPRLVRPFYILWVWTPGEIRLCLSYAFSGQIKHYIEAITNYRKGRGMSRICDIIDWVGGYPYEFAALKAITDFYEASGFEVTKTQENRSYGCHQVVFRRLAA